MIPTEQNLTESPRLSPGSAQIVEAVARAGGDAGARPCDEEADGVNDFRRLETSIQWLKHERMIAAMEAGLRAQSHKRRLSCASDRLAMAVLAVAADRGLAVPRDLSVTGFDDSLLAALASPALTSVRVDYAEFGAAATAALLAVIRGSELPIYQPAAPTLEVRGSTAAAPRRKVKIP